MRLSLSLIIQLTIWIPGFSQVSLSYVNNAPQSGDSIFNTGILYMNPGAGGAGISWDFTKLELTHNDILSHVQNIPLPNLNLAVPYNMIMEDNGYEYYLQSSPDKLTEVACTKGNMSFINTDPLVRMKFPFSYGQEFVDGFIGNANFPDRPAYFISGNLTVIAEGSGVLNLPGLSIANVLRLKQIKIINEVHSCNSVSTRNESYRWFAPGHRYPVMTITTVTIQSDNHEPNITQTAYLNLNQPTTGPIANNPVTALSIAEATSDLQPVSVYPNPFIEKLSYVYFLQHKTDVSLQISDVYGNVDRYLLENQMQNKGMHSAELDLSPYTLTPGVYFLKFIIDQKVITRKVVKI